MDRQFSLFDDEAPRPATRRPQGDLFARHHVPAPGELGVPLTGAQVEIADRVLERLEAGEEAAGRVLPVRIGDVLHLPRDMDLVADLMDHLDRASEDPAWRRSADRLAQALHEWWQGRQ